MRDAWDFESFSLGAAFFAAVTTTLWFVFCIRRQPIEVETNWGGLGGGGGGWRASDSLVALLVTMAAWLLFGTAAITSAHDRRAMFEREEIRLDAKEAASAAKGGGVSAATLTSTSLREPARDVPHEH